MTHNSLNSLRISISLALSATVLGGCVSSFIPDPKPAAVVYQLSPGADAVAPQQGAKIYRVDRPTAPSSLLRDAIVVSPDGRTLAVAENAKWAQSVPDMIQGSLMQELASRSDLIGVLPTSGARTTHRVHLTIQNFEATFDQGTDNAPVVRVQYLATVSDAGTRNLIGTLTTNQTQRAGSNAVSSIVQAQSTANQAAMDEISDWLVTLDLNANPT